MDTVDLLCLEIVEPNSPGQRVTLILNGESFEFTCSGATIPGVGSVRFDAELPPAKGNGHA